MKFPTLVTLMGFAAAQYVAPSDDAPAAPTYASPEAPSYNAPEANDVHTPTDNDPDPTPAYDAPPYVPAVPS